MSILKFGVDIYDVNKRPFKSDNTIARKERSYFLQCIPMIFDIHDGWISVLY